MVRIKKEEFISEKFSVAFFYQDAKLKDEKERVLGLEPVTKFLPSSQRKVGE